MDHLLSAQSPCAGDTNLISISKGTLRILDIKKVAPNHIKSGGAGLECNQPKQHSKVHQLPFNALPLRREEVTWGLEQ